MPISEQIALAAIFIFRTSFYFLQVNQQKRVKRVCTNKMQIVHSEQIYKTSQQKPSRIMFLIKIELILKKQLFDAQILEAMIRITAQNHRMSFWTVTFSTYGIVCVEFFRQSLLKPCLCQKQSYSFREHKLIIFISCLR